MANSTYLDFLGSVWDNLPEIDKSRLAELWVAYEQCTSAVYQKFFEGKLNVAITDILPYSTERWLPYTFDNSTKIDRAAVWSSTQDLSEGINLSVKHMLRISVDGKEPVELSVRGTIPANTRIFEIVNRINSRMGFTLAKTISGDAAIQLASATTGLASTIEILETSIPSENASEYVLGVSATELPRKVPDYPHIYGCVYQAVSGVPELQDGIRDDDVQNILREGSDYLVGAKSTLSFKEPPPSFMWARRTLIDQENPWANFGFLMDVYQPNSQRYADVLQGLWYAYWTGPKPVNIRRSLYLLFGLPTAKEMCTVVEVAPASVTTVSPEGATRIYAVPSGLTPIVEVGQTLGRYDPLVDGIDILDKCSTPGFMTDYIGRPGVERFLTESASRGPGNTDETKAIRMLEEYCFLPQIDVNAFISPDINIGAVRGFLDTIKPVNKTYLFQAVTGKFADKLGVGDTYTWSLDVDLSGSLDSNDTTYSDPAELLTHEVSADPSFSVDPNGVCFQEDVQLEVRSFGTLIDIFNA